MAEADESLQDVRFSNPLSQENVDAMDASGADEAEVEPTEVPVELFETPCEAIGMSGGTAAFFTVKYKDDEWAKDTNAMGQPVDSKTYWIGKDLARARDELAFYEEAQKRIGSPGWDVLQWTTPYKGVVTAPTDLGEGEEREILLLRNARDGYGTCRLLDIKIGEVTAIGGWQGKGHFMAWTQKWLDGVTNSNGQGFRLEGFDGPPSSMTSIMDHAGSEALPGVSQSKMERFLLQRQPAKVRALPNRTTAAFSLRISSFVSSFASRRRRRRRLSHLEPFGLCLRRSS